MKEIDELIEKYWVDNLVNIDMMENGNDYSFYKSAKESNDNFIKDLKQLKKHINQQTHEKK